ncbi:MAG: hypothetical protein MUF81_10070 [Verrucomicrobia bacterium]|nr:hypothetical protein [Verrucomicrobiota bacterium]
MSAIMFRVHGKSGDYVKATLVPANHSEEPHFGLLDGGIITFFLLCVSGLICLLLIG